MKTLKEEPLFIEKIINGYYEYHLPTTHKRFLNKSIFNSAFDLDQDSLEDLNMFLWQNGITCFASNENTILYFLVLKWLAKNNTCLLIFFGTMKAIGDIQDNSKIEKCEWKIGHVIRKFSIDYELLVDRIAPIDEVWKVDHYKETFKEIIKTCSE